MFCAAALGRMPGLEVSVYEAASKPLSKVLLSGGGRCNFTNSAVDEDRLADFYPRGASFLRKSVRRFGAKGIRAFFGGIGVQSVLEGDGRVFPASGRSEDVASALLRVARENGARVFCGMKAKKIERKCGGYELGFLSCGGQAEKVFADCVLFAVGGSWDAELKENLQALGHTFLPPLPSLFSIKLKCAELPQWRELSGACAADAEMSADFGENRVLGRGAMLFTHFGAGGPCALKFSSFGAREFAGANYKFPLAINFIRGFSRQTVSESFLSARRNDSKKTLKNVALFGLPRGFWQFALSFSGIDSQKYWAKFSSEDEKKLLRALSCFETECIGRSTHAEEFVTCGGVDTSEVVPSTCQSKILEGVYFSGECLNIDAVTGGFNLQAAWTTAFNCSNSVRASLEK